MTRRSARRAVFLPMLVAACLCAVRPTSTPAADGLAELGAATVPKDAAFLSSSLRLREQLQRFADSRAYAALRELPAVKRGLEAYEEQKSLPGNPLALASVFLELPENKQALELLADLVANDSFVYGEPSCTTLFELFRKLQETNQVVGILQMVGGESGGLGIELDGFELELDGDDDDEDDDDARLGPRRVPARPVRLLKDSAVAEFDADLTTSELGARLVTQTLVDNVESIVVPDVVWGFKASKPEIAKTQLARLEVLLKGFVQAVPDLGASLDRQQVSGADFVTFSITGESVPWDQFDLGRLSDVDDIDGFDKVLDRLRSLRLVVAIGVVGDRVILSIGDSVEHLRKLVGTKPAEGLLASDAFAPLAAVADRRLTGVSYVSEPMVRAASPSVAYLRRLAAMSGRLATIAGAAEAEEDVRTLLERIADDTEKRLPVPGTWMSYSLLGDGGYEGAVWDRSTNSPLDGDKPLSLLSHAGGSPIGALVVRAKSDPAQFDEIVSWVEAAQAIVAKHLSDEEGREYFGRLVKAFGPVVSKVAAVVRVKLLPSLADGQVGFVLDSKSRTERLHEELPASDVPLPLLEPAIVLGVSDPAVFKEGINDLFDLADELLATYREFAPGTVPDDYRIPDPESRKTDAGTIWSFRLSSSGLDDQVRPSIALGEEAAVLTLVPKQAERLLVKTPLETASKLAKFGQPLATGAALDHVGLLAAIEPWVTYGVRYAACLRRDGEVDPGTKLDADAEDATSRDALAQVKVVFKVLGCLRAAAAETTVEGEARVTRWRNLIEDLPAAEATP